MTQIVCSTFVQSRSHNNHIMYYVAILIPFQILNTTSRSVLCTRPEAAMERQECCDGPSGLGFGWSAGRCRRGSKGRQSRSLLQRRSRRRNGVPASWHAPCSVSASVSISDSDFSCNSASAAIDSSLYVCAYICTCAHAYNKNTLF